MLRQYDVLKTIYDILNFFKDSKVMFLCVRELKIDHWNKLFQVFVQLIKHLITQLDLWTKEVKRWISTAWYHNWKWHDESELNKSLPSLAFSTYSESGPCTLLPNLASSIHNMYHQLLLLTQNQLPRLHSPLTRSPYSVLLIAAFTFLSRYNGRS